MPEMIQYEEKRMSDQVEAFLQKCAESKRLNGSEGYNSPSITELDLDDLVDSRGGSATSTTTTGAAVACGVSALF